MGNAQRVWIEKLWRASMLISKERFRKIYKENEVNVTFLVIILNHECNANCRICIAKHKFKSPLCKEICEGYTTKCIKCCDHMAEDEKFYKCVDEILSIIDSPFVNIIISGGEPTLSNRLIPTLKIIDKYDYFSKTIGMETNGARLADEKIAKELLKRKVKIHLSRYSKVENENSAEFNFSNNTVSNADIRKLAEIYKDQLSVSSVMLKKYIHEAKDVLEFINYYKSLGISNFEFVEVMADESLRNSNKELLKYYDEQLVKVEEISKELVELGYLLVATYGDEAYRMYEHEYNGTEISLSASDLSKQHLLETNNAFSRFLIMPSGEIGVNGIEKR